MRATMDAAVLTSNPGHLLVRDLNTGREVRVMARNAGRFAPGEHIRIIFNGIMTPSIPPQINAASIQRIPRESQHPGVLPREIRATVLQVYRSSLTASDSAGRRITVNYPYAHHFCPRQHIIIHHNTAIITTPLQLNATDIFPVC